MFGFKMEEVMTGLHEFLPGHGPQPPRRQERFMEFIIEWGPKDVTKWANPLSPYFLSQELKGVITIDGLCENQKCWGVLKLEYWKGRLEYNIFFSVDGILYEYVGVKKDMRPWNLHKTHTTCYGTLKNQYTGETVSRSITYFNLDLKTVSSFIKSFRLCRE